MSALHIRQELHQIIDISDDQIVAAVYALLQSLLQQDATIVGSTGSGRPITKTEFLARVRESFAEGQNGQFQTGEELLESIKSW